MLQLRKGVFFAHLHSFLIQNNIMLKVDYNILKEIYAF
jgi:hypothetical protein